jgi:phage shock protein PspC (stress-responsive transcriptional regulator)
MNYLLLLIGLLSLIFAFWTAYGLYRRHAGNLPESPVQQKRWLGVCADFSTTVGIPVGFVRFIILLYTPVGLGAVFYFIYYFAIRKPATLPPTIPERELQITKIESHYYRS